MPVSLALFLKTGILGQLRCGFTLDEVENFLGEPARRERYGADEAHWSFGRLQIRFHEKLVVSFGLGFQGGDDSRLPDCLQVRGFIPDWNTSMEQVRTFLTEENVEYERGGLDGRLLRAEGGVWIHPTPDDRLMSMLIDSGPTAFQDRYFRRKYQG